MRSLLILLALAFPVSAQSITIVAPPMVIARVRPGLLLTARENCPVTITLASGETIQFTAAIAPTYVRGIGLKKMVDQCSLIGQSTNGYSINLVLPPEPAVLRGTQFVAVSIVSVGTLTTPDGVSHPATVTWPDCPIQRLGLGRYLATQITATGTFE